jgi:hypothetical protein
VCPLLRVLAARGVYAALAALLFTPPLRAGSSDVDSILAVKAIMRLQLSPTDSFLEKTPFGFAVVTGATAPGSILGGNFLPPTGQPFTLRRSDSDTFLFSRQFATTDQAEAIFPDGTYSFSIDTASAPSPFTASIGLHKNFPTVFPKLSNTEWYFVTLQYDTKQDFTIFWNDFTNFSTDPAHPSFIQFQIADIFNNTLYTQLFDTPTQGIQLPAGFLNPGFYVGRVVFGNVDQRVSGTTSLAGASFVMSEFIISVVDGPPVITSPTSITVNEGQLFIYTVETTNAAGAFTASPLPDGVKYNSDRGLIGGNPKTAGTYPVGIAASNSIGTGTATLTLIVQKAGTLAITSSTRAAGGVGDPFRFQVLAPGASAAARLSTSALPPGLTANARSGEITGTPTTAGEFAVQLRVTDGNETADGVLLIKLDDDPAFPAIKSSTSATLTPGQAFTYQIAALPDTAESSTGLGTNVTDDTQYSLIGQLPIGLNFDPKTGVISGTFQGNPQRIDSDPEKTRLSGGALVGNVQLFASNSRGTSTVPLVFFSSPTGAVNISTRLAIANGDNVLIGGFIVTGNAPKKLIVRAVGPSLPVAGALQDPVLEIHGGDGRVIAMNDSWRSDNEQAVIDSGVQPADDREAAIVAAFEPGNYTAVVRGNNGTIGVALVELFDLGTASIDTSSNAKLANISTRGLVQTGDNVMIGGFIISQVQSKVIVRAIGPSLSKAGVTGALADTVLELHGANGQVVASNDDWQTNQAQTIKDTGVPPTDPHESAIVATLNPGNYTAVVRGKNGATGVALAEIYALQ